MKIETVDYERAHEIQKRAVRDLQSGRSGELLFVLSHHPTVTIGRRGNRSNILVQPEQLRSKGIAVVETERGGDVTFHGPGQVVAYPVLNLEKRKISPPQHVSNLEGIMARTLEHFSIEPKRVEGIRGVYVPGEGGRHLKIGAVGVALSRGVCYHGLALNVALDPEAFNVIVPCGLKDMGVTSMHLLCHEAPDPKAVADVLVDEIRQIYGQKFDIINAF